MEGCARKASEHTQPQPHVMIQSNWISAPTLTILKGNQIMLTGMSDTLSIIIVALKKMCSPISWKTLRSLKSDLERIRSRHA